MRSAWPTTTGADRSNDNDNDDADDNMAESHTIRRTTRAEIREKVERLHLPRTATGQYHHDDLTTFVFALNRELRGQMNTGVDGPGMEGLLRSSTDATNPSKISALRTKDVATPDTVLKDFRERAEALSTSTSKVEPEIVIRQEAGEEADRRNLAVQAILGAKEGVADGLTTKLGRTVTDGVLLTASGPHYKSIDDYELHELVAAAFQNADRPDSNDILQQLSEIFTFTFDHTKKVSTNYENLRAQCARLKSYGITVTEPQQAMIILANIEKAAAEDYGREFRPALQTVRRAYKYSHVHDANSIKKILEECAVSDAVRKLQDAPTPGEPRERASAVENLTGLFNSMMDDDESTYDDRGIAAAATYASDSSPDARPPRKPKRRAKEKKKEKAAKDDRRGRSKSRKRRDNSPADWESNPCKHCRKNKRHAVHPHVPTDRCFWNPKYQGWRPESICTRMKIRYRDRSKFRMRAETDSSGTSGAETSDSEG